VEAGVSRSLTEGVHLSQFAQAQRIEDEWLHPHRQLSSAGVVQLATDLELHRLNFQALRSMTPTLAQTGGGVKDVQGVLGHSKADTTVDVYMQPPEDGVKQTIEAI
jgi:hypothetical protein